MKSVLQTVLFIGVALLGYYGIRHLYFQPGYGPGEAVPEMSATLADGSTFSISDLRGHYVLLDFWGSWCGPCLREHPDLRDLYNTYRSAPFASAKGFEIVSIAIERDAQRWRQALEYLNPPWRHQILDETRSLKFFNGRIARLYGVRHLPTKFLLAPDGSVIASNWSPGEIATYLDEDLMIGDTQ